MYNGYSIQDIMIYNPFSIMNFLESLSSNKKNPFWIWSSTGGIELIKNTLIKLESTEKIEKLLLDGYVEFKYVDDFLLEALSSNEDFLLSFLVDSGYLTNMKDNIFKIPNNEVKGYFYKGLLELWFSKIHKTLNFNVMRTFEIEDYEDYSKRFQNEILDIAGCFQAFESGFKIIITNAYIANPSNKHYYDMEMITQEGTKIDILFLPIKGKSNSSKLKVQ